MGGNQSRTSDQLNINHGDVKTIIFKVLETVEVKFRGEREIILNYAISDIIGRKMLRKGCEAYLAYLIDIEKEGTML